MNQIEHIYRTNLVHRYDDDGILRYFSASDFSGLTSQDFSFPSREGNMLAGHLYAYPGASYEKLVVFCHGLGGGHRSYMREIETLARHGYRVAAYDNTGCFASEGEDIRGLTQSLSDLDSFLNYAREKGLLPADVTVIGHSWGGYAAGNIRHLHPEIRKIVVLAGFSSVKRMLKLYFSGVKRLFMGACARFERRQNPALYPLSAETALDDPAVRALIIQSDDDGMVDYRRSFLFLKERVKHTGVKFLSLHARGHNPNYTEDAAAYMTEVLGGLQKGVREKRLNTPDEKRAYLKDADWYRMTEQDPAVWDEIFALIDADPVSLPKRISDRS